MFELIDRMIPYSNWVKVPFVVGAFLMFIAVVIALFTKPLPEKNSQVQKPVSTQQPQKVTKKKTEGDIKRKKSIKKKTTNTSDESINQQNNVGSNQANVNKGINNGIMANDLTVNQTTNNYGPQPRTITSADINYFVTSYPDTTKQITFVGVNKIDNEMTNVKNQIIAHLRAKGYHNISESMSMAISLNPRTGIIYFEDQLGQIVFEISPNN
ncbi:hypothetical protein [Dyadobacter sediminis]|uniref:Uncharacterized protein n=1 Tax=Dyadobacter sediminis TaxID=1493691 RepID=A0A5R9KB49_9BACT|nr:hypothetical protein [Dyadobacter sediminis]TLU92004.1 hypothetical protein FEM55_14685 [Dyadobacter sediminis]GGB98316.1 hypothetical protein GCM10011325_27000 [Dyadobacter sediminis]